MNVGFKIAAGIVGFASIALFYAGYALEGIFWAIWMLIIIKMGETK